MEHYAGVCARRSQEADAHNDPAAMRREEGSHDAAGGGQRLPSLVSSDQSEQIYAIQAEGTAPSSRMSGDRHYAAALRRSKAGRAMERPWKLRRRLSL
jgi:hypothetical protein